MDGSNQTNRASAPGSMGDGSAAYQNDPRFQSYADQQRADIYQRLQVLTHRFAPGSQYSQPQQSCYQAQGHHQGSRHRHHHDYYQPTMQPTQRQNSYQVQRARNNPQQTHSDPVYHYVPQEQQYQSYQQAHPSMTPGSYYPNMQQQPHSQQASGSQPAQSYQAGQAYAPSAPQSYPLPRFSDAQQQSQQVPVFQPSQGENYDPDRRWYIQNWPQYQIQRSADETVKTREENNAKQAGVDVLCRKYSECEAVKRNLGGLVVNRLTEQQQDFGRAARYLEELQGQMFQNNLKQKGVTPEMYAAAYAKEMQNDQRERTQKKYSQSKRGGFGGRERGGRGGGEMGMGGPAQN